jgi:alpha-beta hydrolase superfamily lysophospholipase
MTTHTTSKDGTAIAFDRTGAGPPLVIVGGALVSRMSNAPLASLLAEHFTVLNYDRRGRGDSGDTPPHAVAREVEDLVAVVDEAGGSAFVFGTSSGGNLALEGARSGLRVEKLALWEPNSSSTTVGRRSRRTTSTISRSSSPPVGAATRSSTS